MRGTFGRRELRNSSKIHFINGLRVLARAKFLSKSRHLIPLQDPTKDGGYIESLDRHVTPRSLYLTQLRERLGEAAVRSTAASGQSA
jgi:hypothetical protein